MYDLNHEKLRFTPDKDYPIHLFNDNVIDNKLIPTRITKSNIEEKIKGMAQFNNNTRRNCDIFATLRIE